MEPKFKYIRAVYWPFGVFLGEGKEGQTSRPHYPITRPTPRVEYPHAFAIIRGYIDCVGPEGYGTKRFEAGMADTDLPGFEIPGEYTFTTGKDGVLFYCMASMDRSPGRVSRKIVILKKGESYDVPMGRIFALVSGSIEVNKKSFTPPVVVDSTKQDKVITALSDIKGLELWNQY